MTIYRQIVLLVIGLLATVFFGTMITTVENSRAYLQEQLHSHAHDAATSLGISVSRFFASGEIPAVISTANAMFDSGYYRRITITDINGGTIVDRVSNVTLDGVPRWLVELVPLEAPESEAIIMDGWNQAGFIRVTSHPGFAYRQIWNNLSMNALWFMVGMLVLASVSVLVLKVTFRPLSDVERQAEAIARREFPYVTKLPGTRELASIVRAMNNLSRSVKRMLDEADASVSHLRTIAYQSPVTGLPNRQRFLDILTEEIESEEDFSSALFCLIELHQFKNFNNRKGYIEGDRLLREAGELLQSSLPPPPGTVVAHFSGATFAVLTTDLQDVEQLGKKLTSTLCRLRILGIMDTDDVAHIGITAYDGAKSTKQLLSDADTALRSAQSSGANQWDFYSGGLNTNATRSATEWRDLINGALNSDGLRLVFQPVVAISDRTEMHREALVRLSRPGDGGVEEIINAGAFMPIAANLGLATGIDRFVVKTVVDTLESPGARHQTVAMNLNPDAIQDPLFVSWIDELLARHPDAARRICFEVSEYAVTNVADEIERFVDILTTRGTRFGLDNVGGQSGILSFIRSLKPDYIKIDGSFIRSLNQNHDHQYFVTTMVSIAHGLDTRVIAKSVEEEAVWNTLRTLNVDGAQGYFIARPETNRPG